MYMYKLLEGVIRGSFMYNICEERMVEVICTIVDKICHQEVLCTNSRMNKCRAEGSLSFFSQFL